MALSIHDHLEPITAYIVRLCQYLAYSISGGLVVSDWLAVLDHHAGAFGVCLGILTYITNFVFQLINRKAILKAAIRSLGK